MNHPWLVAKHADAEIAAGFPLDNLIRLLDERHPGMTVTVWDGDRLVAVRPAAGGVIKVANHGDHTPAA